MREPDSIDGSEDILDSRDLLRRCEWLEDKYDGLEDDVDGAQAALEEARAALAAKLASAETDRTDAEFAQEDVDSAEAALKEAKEALNGWDGGICLREDGFTVSDEYLEMGELSDAVDEIGRQSCRHGDPGPLVAEDHFTEYAEQLAEDCCELPRDLKWPFTCIDWEEAAEELKADYSTVTIFGTEYYYRS